MSTQRSFLCVLCAVVAIAPSVLRAESTANAGNSSDLTSTYSGKCQDTWRQHERRCYLVEELHNVTVTFADARNRCLSYNAGLASIEDKPTQDIIFQLFSTLPSALRDQQTYIGAEWDEHDAHDDHEHSGGGWHWQLHGSSVNFTNWGQKPGGDMRGHCLAVELKGGVWKAIKCDTPLKVLLCEQDLDRPIVNEKNVLWTIMYALLGLILIALLIGCCIYCMISRNQERRRGSGKFRGIYYKRSSNKKPADNGNC